MFRNARMKVANSFTEIQCITALTLKFVNNALYFGETIRHLHTRISEHMGISACTDKPLSKPSFSNILSHHQSSGHPIDPDDFSILTSCSSTFELLLKESLLISKFQPSLNANPRSVYL